jgi:hypothetical protein
MEKLHDYLERQNEALRDIERQLRLLREEWLAFRQQAGLPVRHEYRFDLLKVENLHGNLHIGVKPDGTGTDLGELAVGHGAGHAPGGSGLEEAASGLEGTESGERGNEGLFGKIEAFFRQEASDILKKIEEEAACPLDDARRQWLLGSVRQQVPDRIRHYANQQRNGDRPDGDMEREIVEKVKQDVIRTFETYIRHLGGGGDG